MGPDYPFLFEAFEFTAARREMPFRRSGTRITTAAGVFLNLFLNLFRLTFLTFESIGLSIKMFLLRHDYLRFPLINLVYQ